MNEPITCYSKKLIIILQVGLSIILISFSLFLVQPIQAQTAGAVSGLVFEDLNLNNTLDYGEKPLLNWQVNLYQNDKLIQTQITDSLGNYYFTGLTPGNYLLKLTVPDTWAPVGAKNVLFNLRAGENFKVNFANYQVIREKKEFGPLMVISNINVKLISPTSAEISWFTTHLATSQVIFAENPQLNSQLTNDIDFGYPFSSDLDFKTVTYHTVTLFGLKPATNYYYRVSSLADPKQWRGAARIFSQELSFTTASLAEGTGGPLEEENSSEFEGKILAISSPEFETETTGKVAAEELQNKLLEGITTNNQLTFLSKDCLIYIWLLLLLNLLMIIAIWSRGKRTNNFLAKRLWWAVLILVLVPTILGYPQCWLNIWLIFTLIIALVLFSGFKKKSLPPPSDMDDQSTEPFPLD